MAGGVILNPGCSVKANWIAPFIPLEGLFIRSIWKSSLPHSLLETSANALYTAIISTEDSLISTQLKNNLSVLLFLGSDVTRKARRGPPDGLTYLFYL